MAGSEDILNVDSGLAGIVERIGENVEHEFAVRVRVHMTMGLFIQVSMQFGSIDEVSIVSKATVTRMLTKMINAVFKENLRRIPIGKEVRSADTYQIP
ncbi:hypothetical protein RRF57_012470 [Xylaria bambusicola]|uniref:Uncharacterized protein n=1 Tax=Xylaria bambusicola TaxID=326684 RepID=A0AAN7ZES5_9PEZI